MSVCVKSVVLKATITTLCNISFYLCYPKIQSLNVRVLSIKFRLDTRAPKFIHNQKYIKSQQNHVSYGFSWNKQRFPLCVHTMANEKKKKKRWKEITILLRHSSFFIWSAQYTTKRRNEKKAHERIVNIVYTRSNSTWPNVEGERVHLVCCGVLRMHWKRVITAAAAYVYAILNA